MPDGVIVTKRHIQCTIGQYVRLPKTDGFDTTGCIDPAVEYVED